MFVLENVKISSYKVDPAEKKKQRFREGTKLDPCGPVDSESIIPDVCRSSDYEFILLGPGRARPQNSSES